MVPSPESRGPDFGRCLFGLRAEIPKAGRRHGDAPQGLRKGVERFRGIRSKPNHEEVFAPIGGRLFIRAHLRVNLAGEQDCRPPQKRISNGFAPGESIRIRAPATHRRVRGDHNFVAIDFETANQSSTGVAIGLVKVVGGETWDKVVHLIKPPTRGVRVHLYPRIDME